MMDTNAIDDGQPFTREKELRLIKNRYLWPGETLCMKRKPREGEKPGPFGYVAYGIITNNQPPLRVYLQPDFVSEENFDSAEEMLDAGWMVD